VGLSQPSHGLVRRHRTWASVLDAGETPTCGLGLLDSVGTVPMGLGVKGSRVQIPPSRRERAVQGPLRRLGEVASRSFDRTMTAVLDGIGRPLPVFDVTNVTVARRADEQATSGLRVSARLPMRQGLRSERSWGRPPVWPPAPRPNGLSAAPVSSAEDVRRIAGEIWEAWNITAAQSAYGRYLRNCWTQLGRPCLVRPPPNPNALTCGFAWRPAAGNSGAAAATGLPITKSCCTNRQSAPTTASWDLTPTSPAAHRASVGWPLRRRRRAIPDQGGPAIA
jgi:hypothetical protein